MSATAAGREGLDGLPVRLRAAVVVCLATRSVAELSALLPVPLGVARVLVDELADLGLVRVHDDVPGVSTALLERVLIGLHRL